MNARAAPSTLTGWRIFPKDKAVGVDMEEPAQSSPSPPATQVSKASSESLAEPDVGAGGAAVTHEQQTEEAKVAPTSVDTSQDTSLTAGLEDVMALEPDVDDNTNTKDFVAKLTSEYKQRENLSAEQLEELATMEPLINTLREATENGDFCVRGALGQRFQRARGADKNLQGKYGECRTHASKKTFRKQWAETLLNATIQKTRERKESFRIVDESYGTYVPFGRLVENYGLNFDRKQAVKATANCARKCVAMAGRWCS